jgi:ell wall binding domain 2 (CWB2)
MSFASRRLAVSALALTALVSGCGKTLPSASSGSPQAIAPVSPTGAGGVATKNTTRLGGADAATDAGSVALAVYPGLTAASRPQAVVVVDQQDWPAALVASSLASAPLRAPLLYSKGDTLPEVSAQALQTMRPTGAAAVGAAQVIQIAATPTATANPQGYRTHTLTDTDPYALASRVQRLLGVIQGREPHQVIVTAADGPPAQAMPAAGLAAQSGAPILLVSTTSVPTATRQALARLHRPSIYVVGTSAAVDSAVLTELGHFGPVKRVASPVGHIGRNDPVGNAVAAALFSDGGFGWGIDEPGHGLAFASALRPLDAPAAAPLSASGDYAPLLLVEGPKGVPLVLSEYLRDIRPAYSSAPAYRAVNGSYNHGWLIGNEEAISATTQAELDTMLEIAPQTSTTATTTETTPSSTAEATPTTSLPLPKAHE